MTSSSPVIAGIVTALLLGAVEQTREGASRPTGTGVLAGQVVRTDGQRVSPQDESS